MKRRMARMARARIGVIAAGVLLSASMLAVLPAASAPASASSGLLTAWFSQLPDPALVTCSTPGDFSYPGAAVEVYNPCGYRVWIHYVSGSTIQSYCVNPGGGLAYDLPIKWAKGDTTDMQLTNVASACDSTREFAVLWCATKDEAPCPNPYPTDPPPDCGIFCDEGARIPAVTDSALPLDPDGVVQSGYSCLPGGGPDYVTNDFVYQLWNAGCDFRIWLHTLPSGKGLSLCLNPGQITPAYPTQVYVQVTLSNTQAPCDAGGPPYSI